MTATSKKVAAVKLSDSPEQESEETEETPEGGGSVPPDSTNPDDAVAFDMSHLEGGEVSTIAPEQLEQYEVAETSEESEDEEVSV
jgi:hypothetical protein